MGHLVVLCVEYAAPTVAEVGTVRVDRRECRGISARASKVARQRERTQAPASVFKCGPPASQPTIDAGDERDPPKNTLQIYSFSAAVLGIDVRDVGGMERRVKKMRSVSPKDGMGRHRRATQEGFWQARAASARKGETSGRKPPRKASTDEVDDRGGSITAREKWQKNETQ